MDSPTRKAMTPSQRCTLARTRIAAACRGEQTAEFRAWKKRNTVVANEILAGKREKHVETRASARQYAWMELEKEFCEKHPDKSAMMLGFRAKSDEPRPLIEDVRWAYQHAMIYATTEFDAPSAGAWLWLLEARENRSQFLGKVFALEQATHGGKLPKSGEADVGPVGQLEAEEAELTANHLFPRLP